METVCLLGLCYRLSPHSEPRDSGGKKRHSLTFRSINVVCVFYNNESISPGHEGGPVLSDGTSAGHRQPSSRDEHLAGAVSHHQRAVGWGNLALFTFYNPASLTNTCLSFSADDPELWNFTLDGIEEPDVPAGGPPSRALRPSTPGSHQMQTRSRTPQRAPGRPPDEARSYSGGQDRAQYRPQHQNQYQARSGEVSWERC